MKDQGLSEQILADQLLALRRTVALSIPVNILLGLASTLVAWHSGLWNLGLTWFAVSSVINGLRIWLCLTPVMTVSEARNHAGSVGFKLLDSVAGQLKSHTILALFSGIVWAFIPALCEGYTSSETLFYLTVVCGITAGAVSHGFAYARVPISFITPPLLSVIFFLILHYDFDRLVLASTVTLYLLALIRGSRHGEVWVRETSRLKNEATSLSRSLEKAHEETTSFAKEMRHQAVRDALTGLLNRRGLTEALSSMTGMQARGACLMLLDLDGFKFVNDAFGHKVGDQVLVEVGRRLENALPEGFTIARLGGDEFTVFYNREQHSEEPAALAQRVISATARPFQHLDGCRIGVSIGIYHSNYFDLEEALFCADAALYAAKHEGRNRLRLFDDALRRDVDMRRDIERDLGKGLASETLEVWYQPIMTDGGEALDGFEALVRWLHPKHGWVPPEMLISVAASAGLSEPLLRFILRDIGIMLRTFKLLELNDLHIAMNISPREMAQLPVDEIVLEKLKRMDLAPSLLEIEITEETAIDFAAVSSKLTRLSKSGIRIAIDDFGVGYSSLGSLQVLRADRVKIDRSFISGIAKSLENQALVQSILSVSRSLNFEVVVEGVETQEDLVKLKEIGCVTMQGYLFAKPMPLDAAIKWAQQAAR
ncbi:diguanylate cyclase (GGDEF)-like protein [Rhizobium sp. SJZ105]|uniref:putative bifunctional diguanylate cyclase/phosphodiesterase n=1 Tax=Rhizobium sp. SJZ105 TaxID=2572678 RepID=UPI0011A6D5BD|nr:EAL domain-containing protein [Rhizobium sp. SJZ105]TWC77305.1 diguanylate cyclase (GGDEF)-like protein [Rhizobium sp. SJZ105]